MSDLIEREKAVSAAVQAVAVTTLALIGARMPNYWSTDPRFRRSLEVSLKELGVTPGEIHRRFNNYFQVAVDHGAGQKQFVDVNGEDGLLYEPAEV